MAFPDDYTMYDLITIDHSKVGSGGVADFDIWIPLSSLSATAQATLRSDGGDARFTLDDGTTQISGYAVLDNSGDCIGFRCKISSLGDSSDTIIRLWYNGTDTALAVGNTYGQYNTFSNVGAYWPPVEDPSGGTVYDKTSNANNLTTYGTWVSGDLVSGKVASAYAMDGTQYLEAADDSTLEPASAIGLSCWVSNASRPTIGMGYISKRNNSSSNQYLLYADAYGGAPWTLKFYVWASGGVVLCEWSDYGTTIALNEKHHIEALYDTLNGSRLFVNGTVVATAAANGTLPNMSHTLRVGQDHYSHKLDGTIEQIRVEKIASNARSITRYNNEANPSTFFTSIASAVSGGTPGSSTECHFPVIGSSIIRGVR